MVPYARARVSTAAKKPSQPCTCGRSLSVGSGVERDAGARELGRRVAERELRHARRGTRSTIASFSSGSTLHVA